MSRNEVAVYTAIFGSYDSLKEPVQAHPDVDFIAFTDNDGLTSERYHIRRLHSLHPDPTKAARMIKTLGHNFLHSKYTYSLWIDASMVISLPDVRTFIEEQLVNGNLGVFRHHSRTTLREEIDYCIRRGRDSSDVILDQYWQYLKAGYPDKTAMVETPVLLRETHHPRIVNFNNHWWQEIENGSRRDQLSFNYAAWETRTPFFYFKIQGHALNNPLFNKQQHMKGDPPVASAQTRRNIPF